MFTSNFEGWSLALVAYLKKRKIWQLCFQYILYYLSRIAVHLTRHQKILLILFFSLCTFWNFKDLRWWKRKAIFSNCFIKRPEECRSEQRNESPLPVKIESMDFFRAKPVEWTAGGVINLVIYACVETLYF